MSVYAKLPYLEVMPTGCRASHTCYGRRVGSVWIVMFECQFRVTFFRSSVKWSLSLTENRASDKCQREKRKTINGDDLLWAMSTLGFEDYVEPLKVYLHKYREVW